MATKYEQERRCSVMDSVMQANDGLRADFNVIIFDNDLNEVVNVGLIYDFASETLYSMPNGVARVKHVDFVLDNEQLFAELKEEALYERDEMRAKRERFPKGNN